MRSYWTVEYEDSEGDLEIKHAFLTDREAEILTDQAAEHGVRMTLYRLSGPMESPVRPGDVLSGDGIRESLALPPPDDV